MPGFDQRGPIGEGPKTGRRRGRCGDKQTTQIEKSSEQTAENKEVIYGLGRGGRQRGGGRGNCFGGSNSKRRGFDKQ